MKNIIILIFLIVTGSGYAQQAEGCTKGRYDPNSSEKFSADLTNNQLKLYVMGGIAAVITKKDKEFAQKSGFTYHDFGCVAPSDLSYYERYNHLVLDHFKSNLKAGWHEEVILNTIGLQNWKKKQ